MAKDPKSKRPSKKKGEEFADLYQNDVEFDEEDFVEEEETPLDEEADFIDDEDLEDEEEDRPRRKGQKPADKTEGKPSSLGKLRERMRPRPVRPGEQDVLQSPIVLSLFGGTLLLLLIGGILWFIIGRQNSNAAFDAAQAALDEGRYSQAILLFENFENLYPTHKLLPDSRIGVGKATILQRITGGSPDWPEGLEALENFIRDFNDNEKFEELKPDLRQYATEIAVGSAKTAAQARDRSLLGIPPKALKIAQRYSQDADTKDLEEKVKSLLILARDAIVKQETYDAAVKRMEADLAAKPPRTLDALHAREGLLARYPDTRTNRKIKALLVQTLDAEKGLVQPETVKAKVSEEDHPALPQPPVSLVMHSRTRSDQSSENRTIYGLAKGCLYGVDTATGEPIWRRSIGLDTPFFPEPINTETPGVLVFDTNHRELLALAERTGKLLWRLPLNDTLSGVPLIHDNVIYVVGAGNRLYKIDLGNGSLAGVLHFSQPLLSPPIAAPDEQHLIAVGDRELIYTVALQDFACVAVSHVGHKRGTGQELSTATVDAPLMEMGHLILLAENDESTRSLLRVFRMPKNPQDPIVQVATERIEGQVRDAPALRGNQLYVPSSGEHITVFTVSDALDQPPLTLLSPQKVPVPHEGPMNLLALEGQVWMATSALRRIENNSGTLAFVGEPLAVGVSSQPIQQLGDSLFVGRHRPYSSSTVLIQFLYDSLRTNWGLTLGSSILAANATGETLVCVNEDGQVYRLNASDFAANQNASQFQQTPSYAVNLPRDLASPLGAVPLEDGSLFVYAGGKEPRAWFITPNAQLGRGLNIPDPLEVKPIAIRDGMVLPLKGRLHFVPLKPGGPRVDDYTRELDVKPAKGQNPIRWMHLERLDDTQFMAVDSAGVLTRFQYRTDPRPHLFEVRTLPLKSPVNVPFTAFEDAVVFADAARQLHVLDAQSFQILGSTPLDGDATNAVWMVKDKVFVETNRSELHAFELTPAPKKVWSLSLGNAGLAGAPLAMGSGLLITKQNGEVWVVDPNTGNVLQQKAVGQSLISTPFLFGKHILAPSLDGSLYPLESLLTEDK